MEKHMAEVHPNSPATILTVRELTQEEMDELGRIARNGFDTCEEKNTGKLRREMFWRAVEERRIFNRFFVFYFRS